MLSRCHLAPPQSSFVAPHSDEHLDASHPTDFPPRVPHPFPVSAPSFSHAHPWPQFPPHHSPSGQASAVFLQPLGGATQRSLLPEAAAAPASAWSRSTRENVVASPAVRSMMLWCDFERLTTSVVFSSRSAAVPNAKCTYCRPATGTCVSFIIITVLIILVDSLF